MNLSKTDTGSHGLFGHKPSEILLSELFVDRFGAQAWQMLEAFLAALGRTALPFDLPEQLRRHEFPGYPTYEQGLPNLYYYFVPDSGWGSDRPFPSDPLDPAFVHSMDGFGLDFGCPLRLKRAIELLESLSPHEQRECREGLKSATKHLPTVEELLWLDVWRNPSKRERVLQKATKSHDWRIAFNEVALRVECKFRPSDWPRLIDGSAHLPLPGALSGRARKQLGQAELNEINVVAVTGDAGVTDQFRRFCRDELAAAENVGAIVYRTFAGETTVFSLNSATAQLVADRIPPQEAQPFQPFYLVFPNRVETAKRLKYRQDPIDPLANPVDLIEIAVPSLPARRIFQAPPLPYRRNLTKRLATGEPVFEHVPPYVRA